MRDNILLAKQAAYVICADEPTGRTEPITATFPKTDYQRSMVHMVRNTLKYVVSKVMKSFAANRKGIYNAACEQVFETWACKYPNSLNRHRSVLPRDNALPNALYLAAFEATKNGLSRFTTGIKLTVKCV